MRVHYYASVSWAWRPLPLHCQMPCPLICPIPSLEQHPCWIRYGPHSMTAAYSLVVLRLMGWTYTFFHLCTCLLSTAWVQYSIVMQDNYIMKHSYVMYVLGAKLLNQNFVNTFLANSPNETLFPQTAHAEINHMNMREDVAILAHCIISLKLLDFRH